MEIKFKNGSTVKSLDNSENTKGYRSKVWSFYCPYCDAVHVDHAIGETIVIDNELYCGKITY